MKPGDAPPDASALRSRAEAAFQAKATSSPESMEALSPEATRQMIHELRVHQIELEMQNEELRRAQMELDGSRARYLDLFDLAPVGYVTVSEPGLILEANLTTATLLGVTRGDLVRQPLSRFILQEDADRFYLLREQLFATGEAQTCDLRMVKSDGTSFPAQLVAISTPGEGGEMNLRAVLTDIAMRKQAEVALQTSEERFRALADSAPILIYLTDEKGACVYVNPRWCEASGLAPEEARGQGWLNGLHEDDRLKVGEQWARSVKSGGTWGFEYRFKNRAGRVTSVYGTAAPIVSVTGTVVGYVGTNIDITERKQAENALREAHDELEVRVNQRTAELQEANQELHHLLAALAVAEEGERRRIAEGLHEDILQRLFAVKLALFKVPDTEKPREARASRDKMEKQIDCVMELLRSMTFDLASPVLKDLGLTAAMRALCAQIEQQHGISVRFEGDEPAPALAPEVEIIVFQAARQLLRNVAQHARAQKVRVAIQRHTGRMELTVEDDGVGVDSAQLTKGFSPSGGYGLFNIRKRMQHLHGEMSIEPVSPRGTRVVLAVPLTEASTPKD